MAFLKKVSLVAGVVAIFMYSGEAHAATIANFSTGYDNGNLIPYNNDDNDWSIISAPTGVKLGAAKVVSSGSWFNPDSYNARWLSAKLNNGSTGLSNTPGGAYTFEYKFNLDKIQDDLYTLSGQLGVDNALNSISLNGNLLNFTQPGIYERFQKPFAINFASNNQSFFKTGINSLIISMQNWNSSWGDPTPGGLVVKGEITSIKNPSKSVPEPGSAMGILVFSAFAGVLLKSFQQKKTLDSSIS